MILNYLKIFVRLFLKQTVFTLINILGLAVGLTCCLVIALFVRHEFSFDKFFANAENLYRVDTVVTNSAGKVSNRAMSSLQLAPLLADNFPAITEVARMDLRVSDIHVGNNVFFEEGFRLVDPAFFRMFDFAWRDGDPATALSGATDVVLTKSAAQKYFGTEHAFGQSLLMGDGVTLRVTGVIDDLPVNTHLTGLVFASMALQKTLEPKKGAWGMLGSYTYVALAPGTNIADFRQQLDAFARANIPQSDDVRFALKLRSIADIHLNYSLGDWGPSGDKLNITVFSAVAIGILLVACANFVNLSTARSAQRFSEVGLRLTMGARRSQLLVQYLGESVLFVLLAIVLAMAFVELSLPRIQSLLGLKLAFDNLRDMPSLITLLGAGLLLGLLAGWYPALLMSRHRPAAALKDPSRLHVRGLALKNVLVVLQFTIAIGMLIAATVIHLQTRFADDLDVGYASDGVMLIVSNDGLVPFSRIQLLKERLLQGSGIAAAAVSGSTPDRTYGTAIVNAEGSETQHELGYLGVDFDYLTLYGIALLSGRLPGAELLTDRVRITADGTGGGSFVLNASAAGEFGWSAEEALGKRIFRDGTGFQVIGVVADTIESAYTAAKPAIYAVPADLNPGNRLSVKLAGNDRAATMAFIERTWRDVNPDEPLVSIFLNELIEEGYLPQHRLQNLAFLFAGMAVVISCMGLFALASFSTQRRTKEIGVRKVMGGSVWSIVLLLTNDFSKLVLLANVIAWPVAWFAMNRWLQTFAYRIDLTPLIFIGSGLIALCIAWVTVGGTAAKAASQKPVLALRYE